VVWCVVGGVLRSLCPDAGKQRWGELPLGTGDVEVLDHIDCNDWIAMHEESSASTERK